MPKLTKEKDFSPANVNRLRGIDGLRGIAALGVLFHHLEQARYLYGFPNSWQVTSVFRLGSLCVSLFFVLSGFLITFLLFEERRLKGNISLVKFYLRRVFRIWPLYFMITILGFFILPLFPAYDIPGHRLETAFFWPRLLLYVFLSPHVATAFYPGVQYAGVLWSVGVEEWFYICWPIIVIATKRRTTLVYTIIFIIIAMLTAHTVVATLIIGAKFSPGTTEVYLRPIFTLLHQMRFGCIALGALGAVVIPIFEKQSLWIRAFFSKQMQILVMSYLGYNLWTGKNFSLLDEQVYSVFFLYIIINLSYNRRPIFNLNHRVLRWLGAISYGIYCFNWIIIVSAILIVRILFSDAQSTDAQIALEIIALALTIGVSSLSYVAFERPFLRLKDKFSEVKVLH